METFNSPAVLAVVYCSNWGTNLERNDPNDGCEQDPEQYLFGNGQSLQYALSGSRRVFNCPSYFYLPSFSRTLLQKDQVTSMLHELTHLGTIFFPPTKDEAYLYQTLLTLNVTKALGNADPYAYYAKHLCLESPTCAYNL